MASPPLVSCIIIFFDCETYIEEAVASVFAQTYPHWELLLVDDGSSDRSTDIARSHAARLPERVRYLHHTGHRNCGMSASRNLGLAHARGEYVGFLDADDVWLPQKLEAQVAILEAHPLAQMVYGRTLIWRSWSEDRADEHADYCYELGVAADTVVMPPALALQLLENRYQTPTTCNTLWRTRITETVGGFEESFRGLYEDQVFFMKVELAAPVFVAGACWAKYRQHRESCSADAGNADYHRSRLPFLRWVEAYCDRQPGTDVKVLRALRRELWKCRYPRPYRLLARIGHRLAPGDSSGRRRL